MAVAGQEGGEEGIKDVVRLTNGSVTGAVLLQSPHASATRAGDSSSSSYPELWSIRYSQRPRSAGLACGPIVWDALAGKLGLSDKTVSYLFLTGNQTNRTKPSHR